MTTLVVKGPAKIGGDHMKVPGDKSISHRALMLAAMAEGESVITGLASGQDVKSTAGCLGMYGVGVKISNGEARVDSPGIESWRDPGAALDCGNSGTTMRLLAGLAAHHSFSSTLDGDDSLRRRPMERVAVPLRKLGAEVTTGAGGTAPLTVRGGSLRGTTVETAVASAQVKSAVILAALGATGVTVVEEPAPTRDHTERMLAALGAPIEWSAGSTRVEAWRPDAFTLEVPGDISSAAFIVAAGVLGGSAHVEAGLNPGRIGFLELLGHMGAGVTWSQTNALAEPAGSITAHSGPLTGVEVDPEAIPTLHDELPLFAVVASQAEGKSVVSGAEELRVKETDRIAAIVDELRKLGADIDDLPDGFVVRGPVTLRGAEVASHGDHRIAMALAVAGLVAEGETRVGGFECADISWPGFVTALRELGAEVEVIE